MSSPKALFESFIPSAYCLGQFWGQFCWDFAFLSTQWLLKKKTSGMVGWLWWWGRGSFIFQTIDHQKRERANVQKACVVFPKAHDISAVARNIMWFPLQTGTQNGKSAQCFSNTLLNNAADHFFFFEWFRPQGFGVSLLLQRVVSHTQPSRHAPVISTTTHSIWNASLQKSGSWRKGVSYWSFR